MGVTVMWTTMEHTHVWILLMAQCSAGLIAERWHEGSWLQVEDALTPYRGPRVKRVTGGTDAERGEVPYQVLINNSVTNEACGGVIVDPFYVLTVRHCVDKNRYKQVKIVAGIVCTSERLGVIRRNVVNASFFQAKSKDNVIGDIALLQLDVPFAKDYYATGPVPLRLDSGYVGSDCRVSGWGATRENGKNVKHLQIANITVFSRAECRKKLPKDLLCAGLKEGGKDSCQGDSGGPLVCGGLLTGLVRKGVGCGEPGRPGRYTEISYYSSWIASVINKPANVIGRW